MHRAPDVAILDRGALRLQLGTHRSRGPSGRQGGDGHAMADRALPSSGCWNRIPLEDGNLKRRSAARGEPLGMDEVVAGGGNQALVEGPAGNLVELLEPCVCGAAGRICTAPRPRRRPGAHDRPSVRHSPGPMRGCEHGLGTGAVFAPLTGWPLIGRPGPRGRAGTTSGWCSADCGFPAVPAARRACSGPSGRARPNSPPAPRPRRRTG